MAWRGSSKTYVRSARAVLAALCALGCNNTGRAPVSAGDPNDPKAVFTDEERSTLAQLSPDSLPPPPADTSNHWADNENAARFGQKMFFDGGFSGKLLDGDNDGTVNAVGRKGEVGKVSCASCHVPESGFTDTRSVRQQISLGAGWGRRRAPSLLDVGHSKLLMWDGRRDAFYNQIFGVIESAVEMNSSRLFAAQQVFLHHRTDYEAIFGAMPALDDTARFPPLEATETGCQALDTNNACPEPMRGAPGDGGEFDSMATEDQDAVTRVVVNVGKALGAYQRLLTCGPSRFDAWMRGDKSALNNSEQRGAALFVGRAKCASCHSGPYLSDEMFHNVGLKAEVVATVFLNAFDRGAAEGIPQMKEDPLSVSGAFSDGNDGRIPVETDASLEGSFRTPRLRCVARRPSFMHTAQMRSLDKVVAFFARGGDIGGFPGVKEIEPIELSTRDRADLVAFLMALDGPGPSADLLGAPQSP
jgi:cytochrome c peroxidase